MILPHCQALAAPTYEELVPFAEAGGAVYYSCHADSSIHNFEELFGCAHRLRYGLADRPGDEVELTFVCGFGDIREGETLRYRPAGQPRRSAYCPVVPLTAELIAEDAEGGRPCC